MCGPLISLHRRWRGVCSPPNNRARSSTSRRRWAMSALRGVGGLDKAMGICLAPTNMLVNSLGPSFLETPMTRPFFENKAFRDEVLGKIKLGRLGQLEELTGAIIFLASDASSP